MRQENEFNFLRVVKFFFKNSVSIFAIATSFLYTISVTERHGFYSALMLQPDMMERTFHHVIYSGFVMFIIPVATFFLYFLVLLGFLMLLLLVEQVVFNGLITKWFKKVKKSQKLKEKKKLRSSFENPIDKIGFYVLVVLIALFSFIVILVLYENNGRDEANEIISSLNKDDSEGVVISVNINQVKENLIFLGCGSRNCAGIDPETKVVHYFPQSVGYSFRLKTELN